MGAKGRKGVGLGPTRLVLLVYGVFGFNHSHINRCHFLSSSNGLDPMLRVLKHLYVVIFTVTLLVGTNIVPNLQKEELRLRVAQQGLRPLSV